MTNDIKESKVIDLTPTWEAAMRIYLQILHPSCKPEVLQMVTEDLLALARHQDNAIARTKETIAKHQTS
jgi:hypothetical protein